MAFVSGTQGYSAVADRFIEAADAVDFFELHRSYIDLMPTKPGCVLDVGAGIGRDAAVLAAMGHNVTAVEPMAEFRAAGERLYASANIDWVEDSLPRLLELGDTRDQFDFVLASGVWHHLDNAERTQAMTRISKLMRTGAIFALSLRNGPAGGGTHVFPTDSQKTVELAASWGLKALVHLCDQPSLMKGKDNVRWAYLAFCKN